MVIKMIKIIGGEKTSRFHNFQIVYENFVLNSKVCVCVGDSDIDTPNDCIVQWAQLGLELKHSVR